MKDSNKNRKFIRSVSAFVFALTFLAGQSSVSVSASDIDFFLADSKKDVSGQTDSLVANNKACSEPTEAPKANNEEELPDWLYNWIKSENNGSNNKTNISNLTAASTSAAISTVTALAAFSVMTANLTARNTPLSVISVMTSTLSAQEKQ